MSESPLRRPAEGWATLGLVVAIALILGWAVDAPAWVIGRGALTDDLALLALCGAAVGFVGPKVGWGRWTTHLVGAALAALVIAIVAGWAEQPGASVAGAFRITAHGSTEAYLDLAWRSLPLTSQHIHYIMVLGVIVWGTMQFASYAVFGHGRPLGGIVAVGTVLVANMALTTQPMAYLVAFTGASLFLLIEMHAFDERSAWLRRRIGDPSSLSAMYLRGGSLFILVTLVASMLLTQRATSAPLAGAWSGVDDQLVRIGREVGRLFPVGGDLRGGGGVSFGSTALISSRWYSDEGIAFTATVPQDAKGWKWRAATYDTFILGAWVQGEVTTVPVQAAVPLLAGTPEDPSPDVTTAITTTVRPDEYRDTLLLAPGAPTVVDRDANVLLIGSDGWFAGVQLPAGRAGYTVESSVLRLDDEEGITGNELRASTEDYPTDISARYTTVPEGAMGPDARALLATILEAARTTDPYDLAVTIQDYLRSDAFSYTTNLTGVPCDSASAVECFARTQKGYCLHYASTMAILLRAADPGNPIPTRLVQGFLPGARQGSTETVTNRGAHAWVEVYFPGYGWIPFDPTGGGVGQPSVIPAGPEVSAAPIPSGTAGPRDVPDPTRRGEGVTGPVSPGPGGSQPGDRTLLIVISALLALVVLAAAIAAWMRGPRGEVSPELAWRSLSRTASRLGFAPRPTQTVYEYAASLGDLVPVAGDDLQVVAAAKVETTYARARLGPSRLDAVRAANRRLRVSLLRLVLRRPRRRAGR